MTEKEMRAYLDYLLEMDNDEIRQFANMIPVPSAITLIAIISSSISDRFYKMIMESEKKENH